MFERGSIVRTFSITALLIAVCTLTGCVRHMRTDVKSAYNQVRLGMTDSAQVLALVQTPETELRGDLISQDQTVIAAWGHKDEVKMWLNLFAFNEDTTFVDRKYFFYVDEHARWGWLMHPKWAAMVDVNVTADPAVLEKPYANENARQIAMLQFVLDKFTSDELKVRPDNKMIGISKDVANEAIGTVLLILKESPARAVELSRPQGLEFELKSFYKGRMYLSEQDGVINMDLKTGAYAERTKGQFPPLTVITLVK